jgi:redox-sensitive bicupin YhaK (pirin superfamily)
MIEVRKSAARGSVDIGWLHSRHTFSFGHYDDPAHMGIGPLRVINEDRVKPAAGFQTHGHRDMEIISYVLEGALEHRDSLGTGSVIPPGDVQRMSAGTGIRHSEFNHSSTDSVHFLQIWILPEREGLAPGYEQKAFGNAGRRGRLQLVGSRTGRDGSVVIHQDVDLHVGLFDAAERDELVLRPGRIGWVQVARGSITVNGSVLDTGDGVALAEVDAISLRDGRDAEVLVFDMLDVQPA